MHYQYWLSCWCSTTTSTFRLLILLHLRRHVLKSTTGVTVNKVTKGTLPDTLSSLIQAFFGGLHRIVFPQHLPLNLPRLSLGYHIIPHHHNLESLELFLLCCPQLIVRKPTQSCPFTAITQLSNNCVAIQLCFNIACLSSGADAIFVLILPALAKCVSLRWSTGKRGFWSARFTVCVWAWLPCDSNLRILHRIWIMTFKLLLQLRRRIQHHDLCHSTLTHVSLMMMNW